LVGLVKALKMKPYLSSMKGPEGEESGPIIMVCVGNGRRTGGGFEVTPSAYVDDGLLDLIIVRDFPLVEIGALLSELNSPENEDNQYVYYGRMDSFQLETEEEAPLNLDGEPTRGKHLEFTVLHKKLKFIAPPDTPLLRPKRAE
jgi:diacylglycerol kinase family enzyme